MYKILVLMSTYNGKKYIDEQIDSILKQKNVNVSLLIRDDNSTDDTFEFLKKYEENECIKIYHGKNLGPAYSFLDLMKHTELMKDDFDYYAFADQDDYWEENKLFMAAQELSKMKKKYKLYTSSLKTVDKSLNYIGMVEAKKFEYPEFLLRNQCAGCTMVFNKDTLNLVNDYYPEYIEMHDFWILRILLCIDDSEIYYDNNSYILYRQHGNNVVGANKGILSAIKIKFKQLIGNEDKVYQTVIELKKGYASLLTNQTFELINMIIDSKRGIKNKLKLLKKCSKYKFSLKIRKLFFIWNVLYNNL